MSALGRRGRLDSTGSLAGRAAKAAAWSGLSTIALRFGSFAVGIVLARVLSPDQFGVYAVALAVQSILMAVADLGLSADLIRSDDYERKAPTVATLGLVSGGLLALFTILSAPALAELLGSSAAAPAIAVLGGTLLLAGGGVVPYAMLQRRFDQKSMFTIGVVDFVASTAVTLLFVALGWGALSIALGRLLGQTLSTGLQFVFAKVRPRYGIDRSLLRPILAFGLPITGANMLSLALLNIDNIVLARVAGATALGFYVLAFNISNWPMSALSQVLRSISLPYIARADNAPRALTGLVAVAWALALPAGVAIATLAGPIIAVVYGERWLPAAAVLAALGVFGALRVIFDTFASYLYAIGKSRPVLWLQALWFLALTVGMIAATGAYGIVGAGWVHVVVALFIMLPAYLYTIHRAGVSVVAIAKQAWVPVVGALPAALAAALATRIESPVLAMVIGGLSALLVYGAVTGPWLMRRLRAIRGAQTNAATNLTPREA
ncbi:oligosaccharide flippase family protein [Microbacterium deminutum]|uniref:Lipopolysaccharide biosynthesis protein n=1 Tax=Microbacterium deminutum TaxID=344164 RepID=A0ABP5BWY2_9MICO